METGARRLGEFGMDLDIAQRYAAVVVGEEFENEIGTCDLIFFALEFAGAENEAARRRIIEVRNAVLQGPAGVLSNVREDTVQTRIVVGMKIEVEDTGHKDGISELELPGFGIAKHLVDDRLATKVGGRLGKAALRHSKTPLGNVLAKDPDGFTRSASSGRGNKIITEFNVAEQL